MNEKKPYRVNDSIRVFLPPDTITAEPLDFDWDEAENAVLFTSGFTRGSFTELASALTDHFAAVLGSRDQIDVEAHEDIGCISFWMTRAANVQPKLNVEVDAHIAYCQNAESLESLHSWIGSTLLTKMAKQDAPSVLGMIRFRPRKANFP